MWGELAGGRVSPAHHRTPQETPAAGVGRACRGEGQPRPPPVHLKKHLQLQQLVWGQLAGGRVSPAHHLHTSRNTFSSSSWCGDSLQGGGSAPPTTCTPQETPSAPAAGVGTACRGEGQPRPPPAHLKKHLQLQQLVWGQLAGGRVSPAHHLHTSRNTFSSSSWCGDSLQGGGSAPPTTCTPQETPSAPAAGVGTACRGEGQPRPPPAHLKKHLQLQQLVWGELAGGRVSPAHHLYTSRNTFSSSSWCGESLQGGESAPPTTVHLKKHQQLVWGELAGGRVSPAHHLHTSRNTFSSSSWCGESLQGGGSAPPTTCTPQETPSAPAAGVGRACRGESQPRPPPYTSRNTSSWCGESLQGGGSAPPTTCTPQETPSVPAAGVGRACRGEGQSCPSPVHHDTTPPPEL